MYSTFTHQGIELSKPVDVYNLLGSQMRSCERNTEFEVPDVQNYKSSKCGAQFLHKVGGYPSKVFKIPQKLLTFDDIHRLSYEVLRKRLTYDDIQRLSYKVRQILNK